MKGENGGDAVLEVARDRMKGLKRLTITSPGKGWFMEGYT